MSQTGDHIPVFKYRGAISREDILNQEIGFDDFDDDELEDIPLPKPKKKTSRKHRSHKDKSQKKQKLSRSTSSSTKESVDEHDDPAIEEEESVPSVPNSSLFDSHPRLGPTFANLRENQNRLEELKKFHNTMIDISDDEEERVLEEKTVTIQVRVRDRPSINPASYKVNKDDRLIVVLNSFCGLRKLSIEQCSLKLSGLPVDTNDTFKGLGMINDDVLEVIITQPNPAPAPARAAPTMPSAPSAPAPIELSDSDEDERQDEEQDEIPSSSLPTKPAVTEHILPLKSSSVPAPTTKSVAPVAPAAPAAPVAPIAAEDAIKLKIRISNKDVHKFKCDKNKPLGRLFAGFLKKVELDASKVKFMFDGMALSDNQTPMSCDMDDDDLIDAIVK